MVNPEDIPRIVSDAARLLQQGEIVVFGSAALAFWLRDPPHSRDVDLWATPEEGAAIIEALMGELSWYQDKHGAYVEIWGPETFLAPRSWRTRAKQFTLPEAPQVHIVVPHPHDVLIAKVERLQEHDLDHVRRIIAELPLTVEALEDLASEAPQRLDFDTLADCKQAFELHLEAVKKLLIPTES